MKQAIVLSTHHAQFEAVAFKGDFETNLSKIAGWGYEGVELAIRDPALVDRDLIEATLGASGLCVPAIGTGQAWGEERLSLTSADPSVRRAAAARIKSHIPLAARLNAVIILGLIRGITPYGQTHAQSLQFLVEGIRECAQAAAPYGVCFAIEPLNRYETDLVHTTREGLELLDRVGAENFGLLLDTFHMNIEEPCIEASIRICGDRLFHFHIADSNRWHPGAGHLDFRSVFAALDAVNYQGFVSGEFMPHPDADTAAARSITYVSRLLADG